jgi:hypothetical protein
MKSSRTDPRPSTPSCAQPKMPRSAAKPPTSTPPAPADAGTSLSGSRTARAKFPRRDFDQDQAHCPLAEPVLRSRTIPARQHKFLAARSPACNPISPRVRPQRWPRRPSLRAGEPSAPRAYRLKASNAAPPISTFAGAIPTNFRGPLTSLTLFRAAAGSLQIATRRCSAWPRCRPGSPNLPEGVD